MRARCACPPSSTKTIDSKNGGTSLDAFAPGRSAHPHMGICESRPRIDPDQVWHAGRAARGAMRSAARRPGPGEGLASEDCCSSQHHLISGRIVVRAHFPHACGEEANEDETHLRNGIGWPLGGTVIIHPVRSAATAAAPALRVRCYAFIVAPAGTRPVVR